MQTYHQAVVANDALGAAAAVVVNWGTADLTTRSAQALVADGLPPERLVLVDNGSEDDSAQVLRARFPHAHHLTIAENVGYARAANRGAKLLDADAYFFINNDAFVDAPGSLRLLRAALDGPSVGLAVPRLLNADLTLQPNAVPLPTPLTAMSLASGASRLLPNRLRPRWSTHWDHGRSQVIRASRAAVIAVRGAVWRTLGGWAEEDWMFGEDIDLSWRALKAGWLTWFEHDATFIHLGNSSGFDSVRRVRLTSTATRRVIERQLPGAQATAALATLSAGHLARGVAFTALRRKLKASCSFTAATTYWPGNRLS